MTVRYSLINSKEIEELSSEELSALWQQTLWGYEEAVKSGSYTLATRALMQGIIKEYDRRCGKRKPSMDKGKIQRMLSLLGYVQEKLIEERDNHDE